MLDASQKSQSGFTLVELMVVVAILAVISSVAVLNISSGPKIGDLSKGLAAKIGEAARLAKSRGPVRADVVAAQGESARSQIAIINNGLDQNQTVRVEVLNENDLPGNSFVWDPTSVIYIPPEVIVAGYRNSADLEGGQGGPETALTAGSTLEVKCYTTGACDAMTLYLQTTKGGDRRTRVVLMPLNGTPLVYGGW